MHNISLFVINNRLERA